MNSILYFDIQNYIFVLIMFLDHIILFLSVTEFKTANANCLKLLLS